MEKMFINRQPTRYNRLLSSKKTKPKGGEGEKIKASKYAFDSPLKKFVKS